MAKLGFYQFLKSNHGADLLDMLCIPGQPSPALWTVYLNWWGNSKQDIDGKLAKVYLQVLVLKLGLKF